MVGGVRLGRNVRLAGQFESRPGVSHDYFGNHHVLESAMETTLGPRTQSVPALERGLLILEHLAQSRRGVTLSQLTSRLQLPRSSGHALLLTYQRCGYVQRDKETGRYRLG